jgi:diguanylate cyclase (GGDEF)-like protein/PAS domain S-box-containing protein
MWMVIIMTALIVVVMSKEGDKRDATYLLSLSVLWGSGLVGITLFTRHLLHIFRERDQIEEALRDSTDQYRILVDTMNDGLATQDETGKLTYFNDKLCEMWGYSREELTDRPITQFLDKGNQAIFSQQLEKQMAGQTTTFEIEWIAKHRNKLSSIVSTRPTFDSHGVYDGSFIIITDIRERKHTEQELLYLATHDPLTDLPNRQLFNDRLDHALSMALRNNLHLAIMFLDLDDFKWINDNFGHDKGDKLLKAVAARLRGCVRESDTIARLGGDEFSLILERIPDPIEKIMRELSHPHRFNGYEKRVTASIGISFYPEDGDTGDILLQKADEAMYQVKRKGKNNYLYHSMM